MAINRYYSAIAQDTTITSGITSSSTTVVVAGTTGYPTSYPFALALDYGSALEEIVDVTGVAGLTLTITRAVNGTTAVAHAAGATVRHVITARDLTDAQTHYNTALSAGAHGITGALATFFGSTTSANLASVVTDETGSGSLTFATNPTITSPVITDLTTKGDLIAGTGSGVITRLAVGSDGQTLVANSSQTTGLAYTNNFAAGKNAIINGDFGVWQRGTSFSNPSAGAYLADRWTCDFNGTGATRTLSQQTFTPGTAPVAGYEGTYFFRWASTVAGTTTYQSFIQKIEDVRKFAGQTVTISFWAKADATRTIQPQFVQNFGSGGSANVTTSGTNISLTTSWVRYSQSISIPSISGLTIGTSSSLWLVFALGATTGTIDIWGVQVEAGSVATAFQTATGTQQAELAACQRYYISNGQIVTWQGNTTSASSYAQTVTFPVTTRTAPTIAVTNYSASNFSASPTSGTATTGGFLGANSATATASAAYYQFTYTASAEL